MIPRWRIRRPPVSNPLSHRNTGWKIDVATDEWVGRMLLPTDIRRITYDDNGPEELLRLGAPIPGRTADEAEEWGPIVDKWGLQILDAAGFINGEVPREFANQTFIPEGKYYQEHPDDPLHPVLRRDMWSGIVHHDWELIQPSLQIASAMLDEPDVLRFFQSYFQGWRNQYMPTWSETVKIVEVPRGLSDQDYEKLYFRFASMRNYVDISFVDDELLPKRAVEGAVGVTCAIETEEGMRPGTTNRSKIFLAGSWLENLRAHQSPPPGAMGFGLASHQDDDGIPVDHRIPIYGPSSRLRTILALATTLLHELAHAVVNACVDDPELEPFFADDLAPEAGFSLEKHIFHGEVIGWAHDDKYRAIAAPYGSHLVLNPVYENRLLHPPLNGTMYPVPVVWTATFFERQFWEETIARFGGRMFECPVAREWSAFKSN